MKINPLDAHDRLLHFKKSQGRNISECCQDLIDQKPFGDHPFYAFCHPRTEDDGVNKRFIWSPWIWKPRPQTNSHLYKLYPGTDKVKIIWILPERELWAQFQKGKLTEDNIICNSVYIFDTNKESLCIPEDDDPSPERAQEIAFEYQPQLFKRETLPPDKQIIWDKKMAEREANRSKNEPRR